MVLEPDFHLSWGESNYTGKVLAFWCGQISLLAEPSFKFISLCFGEQHSPLTLLWDITSGRLILRFAVATNWTLCAVGVRVGCRRWCVGVVYAVDGSVGNSVAVDGGGVVVCWCRGRRTGFWWCGGYLGGSTRSLSQGCRKI